MSYLSATAEIKESRSPVSASSFSSISMYIIASSCAAHRDSIIACPVGVGIWFAFQTLVNRDLVRPTDRLFVIGDPKQAIYGFRGADVHTYIEAKDAILKEAKDEQGQLVLVPDERKRAAARRDMEVTRARILQVLELDAGEHGLPWPPAKENGNDR